MPQSHEMAQMVRQSDTPEMKDGLAQLRKIDESTKCKMVSNLRRINMEALPGDPCSLSFCQWRQNLR